MVGRSAAAVAAAAISLKLEASSCGRKVRTVRNGVFYSVVHPLVRNTLFDVPSCRKVVFDRLRSRVAPRLAAAATYQDGAPTFLQDSILEITAAGGAIL